MTRVVRNFTKSKGMTILIVTAAIIVFFYIMNPAYLSFDNVRGIMYAMSLSGTITCGMACLMMSGAIDLASGAEGMLAGVLVAFLLRTDIPWFPAVLMILGVGAVFGLVNAFFANILNFMPFIATIAMSSVYQGIAGVITTNQPIMITNKAFWELGSISLWVFPLPFIIMVVLLIIYGLLIANTKFGRQMLLCGGNRNAARLAGISYKKITTIMYINNGCIASLGGIVLAARMHSGSMQSVIGSEMDGMTAAIIGGVSFLGGGSSGMTVVFIGIMMLNCFKNGLYIIQLDPYWQVVSNGALLVLALIVDFFREKRRLASLKAPAREAPAKQT